MPHAPVPASSSNTSTVAVQPPQLMSNLKDPSRVRGADVVKVLAIVVAFAAGIGLVIVLAPLLLSIVIAAFIAVAADPAVRFFQRRGLRRGPAVAAFATCLTILLVGFSALFLPPLVDQGAQLAKDTPGYVQDIRDSHGFRQLDRKFDVVGKASAAVDKLPKQVGSQLGTVVGAVFAGIFGAVTVLFLMVLLLLGGSDITGGILRIFPKLAERRWWQLIIDSYRSISAYVVGTFLVALVAGLAVLIPALILGLPNPLPLALWMALLDIVPLVGALIGAAPAIAVAFLAGSVTDGVIMLVILFLYQQVENVWVQPAVLGKVVSLSPVIIFVAILAGSQLLGITGALLAIPLAGVVQIFLREVLKDRFDGAMELPPIAPDHVPDPPSTAPA
ncbi:MAG: AI-2E family transporter [Thermoleophilia bacterium]|nr:AI-2E family transporter [Thermoleophilia bacterium]